MDQIEVNPSHASLLTKDWWKLGGLGILALWALSSYASPPTALIAGSIFAILIGNPKPAWTQKSAKIFLQLSVVLLGFGMDLAGVLKAGLHGFGFALGTITAALILGSYLGKWLKLHERTAILISVGTAICGGSAIAAVGSVIDAPEADMSVAIGTVFLLNAVALLAFPAIGHALGLRQTQFGTWAGVAIHDISSVVGAAKVYGPRSLEVATAVKLSRSLWIVPVALGARHWHHLKTKHEESRAKLAIPWFIGFFLLASVARTFVPWIAHQNWIGAASTMGLNLTLLFIGANLSLAAIRKVGWRPLAQGIAVWAMLASVSLFVIIRYL